MKGETGSRGATGPTGMKGETGSRGATGPTGMKGETGSRGATGPTGMKGETGSRGATGPTGMKGMTGAQGPTGPPCPPSAQQNLSSVLVTGNSAGSTDINMNNNSVINVELPTNSGDATSKSYVDYRDGMMWSYSGWQNIRVVGDTNERPLIDTTNITGSLTFPANFFQQGDAYHIVIAGECSFNNNDQLTLRVKLTSPGQSDVFITNFVTTLLGTPNSATFGNENMELETDFVVTSDGTSGALRSNTDFTYSDSGASQFHGTRHYQETSNFDTTLPWTLVFTRQFNSTSIQNGISGELGYMRRTFGNKNPIISLVP